MIRVSVIGATGYAGVELVRLLCGHPQTELKYLVSHSFAGQELSELYPNFAGSCRYTLADMDLEKIAAESNCIFTSLPHGTSDDVIAALYGYGKVVIDLSGDYRYNSAALYEKWYGTVHAHPELLAQSVYGLPELHREELKKTRLVGNPGCYTTCSILALAPLAAGKWIDPDSIIIDAKSGASGAGRSLSQGLHFCELNENMRAYKLGTHRHTSEIEQELSLVAGKEIALSFSPHILPINRGILATSYANLAKDADFDAIMQAYEEYYADEPFVVLHKKGSLPELKHVCGSNYIHIGFVIDQRLRRIIVVSAIDNLIKGAGGQAVQNMNLLFGLDEKTGLSTPAWYF